MKKIFPILLVTFFFFPIGAARAGQRLAVEVSSALCGTEKKLTTSGVPVVYHGASYVLTSAWGVLEEDEGTCHSVFDPRSGRTLPATLKTIEWTHGFALLLVPGLSAETVLDESLPDAPASPNAEIVGVEGKAIVSRAGHYVSVKSDRHYLIETPYAYELASDNIDKGLIGAPVYGTALDAIVSGEWLETIAGKRGRVREWTNGSSEPHNHLILVPLKTIWSALEAGRTQRRFLEPSESKLGDRSTILSGALKWVLSCPPQAGEPPPDGIGPIGGGDGVGIGGEAEGVEGCTLEVSPTKTRLATPTFGPKEFFPRLEKDSVEKGTLRTDFFYRNITSGFPVRRFFLGWQDYFNDLLHQTGVPVFFWVNQPEPTGGTLYDQLRVANHEFEKILQATFPLIAKESSNRHDYRMMYTVSAVLGSLQWKTLSWFDMQEFTGIPHGFLGEGIMWEGRPLLDVLKEKTQGLEKIRTELGYDP